MMCNGLDAAGLFDSLQLSLFGSTSNRLPVLATRLLVSPLRVAAHRHLRRLDQQKAQQAAALFAEVSQPLMLPSVVVETESG